MTSLPPDLKVLCRKLTSIPPAQLPHSLPSLLRHALRCRDVLSAPQDPKPKADASQTSLHIHKLKTSITALLNGRTREGRLVATCLIKALVDVGGWETLRGTEPWVRGLLSIVQKADPAASKELAVAALTKIYLLLHPFQTLVREIATPTIPAFIAACLQLLKPPLRAPPDLAQTICESFATLIPLYSPTFRPSSSHIRTAVRSHLAPTSSDQHAVPASLRRASRRLVASLHHVAAKSSGSDEWRKLVDDVLHEFHATADQVFRAVDESWGAISGHGRPRVDVDGEPRGGDASAVDKLPPWSGLDAGADRLAEILHFLADIVGSPTKAAVAIPVSSLMEAVARVCFIARLSKSQTWEQSLETNPAVGREEKDELWSLMPDLHVAAMQLVVALFRSLQRHMVPIISEVLDHLVRIFRSGIAIPAVRATAYTVLGAILPLAGPTLSKASVDLLDPLIAACCRDLQQDAGLLVSLEKPAAKDTRKNAAGAAVVNADLFLRPQAATTVGETVTLGAHHRVAATELLAAFLSHLPQANLKPFLRGLLDKTAILTRNRDAMLASVLNPYKDQRGRMYPSILPHLCRQFPRDQSLEVLRSNLRTSGSLGGGTAMFASIDEDADVELDDVEDVSPPEASPPAEMPVDETVDVAPQSVDLPIQVNNPFEPSALLREASPPKRKHQGPDRTQPKRQELEPCQPAPAADEQSDDDSDGSVHLNMVLEDEEEEEEEEEEE